MGVNKNSHNMELITNLCLDLILIEQSSNVTLLGKVEMSPWSLKLDTLIRSSHVEGSNNAKWTFDYECQRN